MFRGTSTRTLRIDNRVTLQEAIFLESPLYESCKAEKPMIAASISSAFGPKGPLDFKTPKQFGGKEHSFE